MHFPARESCIHTTSEEWRLNEVVAPDRLPDRGAEGSIPLVQTSDKPYDPADARLPRHHHRADHKRSSADSRQTVRRSHKIEPAAGRACRSAIRDWGGCSRSLGKGYSKASSFIESDDQGRVALSTRRRLTRADAEEVA